MTNNEEITIITGTTPESFSAIVEKAFDKWHETIGNHWSHERAIPYFRSEEFILDVLQELQNTRCTK